MLVFVEHDKDFREPERVTWSCATHDVPFLNAALAAKRDALLAAEWEYITEVLGVYVFRAPDGHTGAFQVRV